MAICPRCRFEFAGGVMVCPDCQVTLEGFVPPQSTVATQPDESWVTVGKVWSGPEARLAKGSLDSNNIPSVLLSSNFDNATEPETELSSLALIQAGNEAKLIMVPREFRDEAEMILDTTLGEDGLGIDAG